MRPPTMDTRRMTRKGIVAVVASAANRGRYCTAGGYDVAPFARASGGSDEAL